MQDIFVNSRPNALSGLNLFFFKLWQENPGPAIWIFNLVSELERRILQELSSVLDFIQWLFEHWGRFYWTFSITVCHGFIRWTLEGVFIIVFCPIIAQCWFIWFKQLRSIIPQISMNNYKCTSQLKLLNTIIRIKSRKCANYLLNQSLRNCIWVWWS
jgi:hypothetical protein